MAKYTLSVLVDNHAGVLSRVSGLFSRRGFNIDSLAVGVTEDPAVSRVTIIVNGDDHIVEQVVAQLGKLLCVRRIKLLPDAESVRRELLLIKVRADGATRQEVTQIASIFRAKIIDVSLKTLTIEITGEQDKTEALLEMLREFGVLEVVRTGLVAVERGPSTIDA